MDQKNHKFLKPPNERELSIDVLNLLIGNARCEAVSRYRLQHDDEATPKEREQLRSDLAAAEWRIKRVATTAVILSTANDLRTFFIDNPGERAGIVEDLLARTEQADADPMSIPVREIAHATRKAKSAEASH
jgi:hypothetical protein